MGRGLFKTSPLVSLIHRASSPMTLFPTPRTTPLNNAMSSLRHLRRPQQTASLKRPLGSMVNNGRVRTIVTNPKLLGLPTMLQTRTICLYLGFMYSPQAERTCFPPIHPPTYPPTYLPTHPTCDFRITRELALFSRPSRALGRGQ